MIPIHFSKVTYGYRFPAFIARPALLCQTQICFRRHSWPMKHTVLTCTLSNNVDGAFNSVKDAALARGYTMRNTTIGPLVRLSLHDSRTDDTLASLSGAILLNDRLHIESYRSLVPSKSTSLLMVTPPMLIFISALALASDRGVRQVYGLAIEDDPSQHRRLINYLARFGGQKVRRIDDSLASLPARIFYGGFGTIIKGDIPRMLNRGMAMLRRQTKSSSNEQFDTTIAIVESAEQRFKR